VDTFFNYCVSPVADLFSEVVDAEVVAVGSGEFLGIRTLILVEGAPILSASLVLIDTSVEECEALMILLRSFLVPERLPVLFKLPCERILPARDIRRYHSSVRRIRPSTSVGSCLYPSRRLS
jgi:hypothetical protein